MSLIHKIASAACVGPMRAFGNGDPYNTYSTHKDNFIGTRAILLEGHIIQFNVGMYSALVSTGNETKPYVCMLGSYNASPGLGYSDSSVLREGDEVMFSILAENSNVGMILARKPTIYSVDTSHPVKVKSETDLERRTHFFSNTTYRKMNPVYSVPLDNKNDMSTRRHMCNRPTDIIPGEASYLNQHRCGTIDGLYSTSMVGGGSQIKMFALENRIRVVADSIIRYTMTGNANEWHNRRYLSNERSACMYQEERMGMKRQDAKPFEKADYDEEFYFTKNIKKKQTNRPRLLQQEGFYAGMSARYCMQPDPESDDPRTMDQKPKDPGVARESIDPTGQYRLAAVGMLGFERIGRIPVPVRIRYPWQKESEEPDPKALTAFEHDDTNPGNRQLELADRVAYDLKNSYARLDEAKSEFYVPEESELAEKVKDVYDQGFTDSTTVRVEKYDKRRSGIWQGEDGSIILRDAWGSEIVMLGGNIQLSCAGNIEIMPGKSALTMAGDDAIVKAHNSIDITAANNDVRVNGYRNVQVMAGVDDSHPGGVTIEAKGKSGIWNIDASDGGESTTTRGILLKSEEGNIVTNTENMVLKSKKMMSIVAGEDDIPDSKGQILMSAHGIYSYGDQVVSTSHDASMILTKTSAVLTGKMAIVAGGKGGAAMTREDKIMVPLTWADIDDDINAEINESTEFLKQVLTEEETVSQGYDDEVLEKMHFKFRSSQECDTTSSWELGGTATFALYQPFWSQVRTKFETLKGGVNEKGFDDHPSEWSEKTGNPWPGKDAVENGKYTKLASGSPENMDTDGMNKSRKEVSNKAPITQENLFPGYRIRE